MGNNVKAQDAKVQGVGLVRNAHGEPQFTDYHNIPEVFYPILTDSDWIYINKQRNK